MDIFRSYDIRGLYPKELNEENALKIGRAIGTLVKNKPVFVNYDNRAGSIEIKQNFVSGLLMSGATVYELGMGPVTVSAFASFMEKAYGICISASHNPKEYTGILAYKNGVTVTPEPIKKIYKSGKFRNKYGKPIPFSYDEKYIERITKGIGKLDLKVGIDSMGGSTTYLAPFVFDKAGAKVSSLRTTPSSNFYGKTPEPLKENARELGELVRRHGLDMGLQLDADGDRCLIVDETGKALDPMVTAMILIKYLKLKRTAATIACSSHLEKYTKIKYTRTGRPNVEAELKTGKYDFGVETSAHFYFGRYYPFSDGVLTGLLIAGIIKRTGKNLSVLTEEFPKIYYINKALKFDGIEKISKKMRMITQKLKPYKKQIKIDGIKIPFNDGFMLFRPSNTEPLIRVYYEGTDEKALRRIGKLVDAVIK
jgi:phosphomannomutase